MPGLEHYIKEVVRVGNPRSNVQHTGADVFKVCSLAAGSPPGHGLAFLSKTNLERSEFNRLFKNDE